VVLRLTGADEEPPVPLTPEEQAAIAASKAAAARGEFATDEQVRAVWAKRGL
jgi:predicted transcriptional regulator